MNQRVIRNQWNCVGSGSGPGILTPDGCAVDLYALLPPWREPDIVHSAGGPDAAILELGSGAGRVTGPLVALGHQVTAVDHSPEMLAHVRGAEKVCARIEELRLTRRFDVVLLASYLINVVEDGLRRAFLDTCARHVRASGCVIIEQLPSSWFSGQKVFEELFYMGVIFRLLNNSLLQDGLLSVTMEYQVDDRIWTHSFTAWKLSEDYLRSALAKAGLALDGYLTDDKAWLRAVPL